MEVLVGEDVAGHVEVGVLELLLHLTAQDLIGMDIGDDEGAAGALDGVGPGHADDLAGRAAVDDQLADADAVPLAAGAVEAQVRHVLGGHGQDLFIHFHLNKKPPMWVNSKSCLYYTTPARVCPVDSLDGL